MPDANRLRGGLQCAFPLLAQSTMNITTLALIVLAPVLVWRVYGRVKGMMKSQRSILSRHYTGVIVFTAMVLVAASEVAQRPLQLASLVLGLGAGIGLGLYGLRKTRFDKLTLFYTPPARIGMIVAMLFFARLMQIGLALYMNSGGSFTDSPLTMLMVGLLGGYFGIYSAGLIRWRRAMTREVLRG